MAEKIPKVAVITRTINRAILLDRAILSIHKQTMTDFVHVIINNGGDPKIVDKVLKKHQKIISNKPIVIHNKVTKNMYAASNQALKSVDSEYVVMHDNDDYWDKDFLKEMVNHLEKTNEMGVVATTDLVYEEVTEDKIIPLEHHRINPNLKFINLYQMCFKNYTYPINFLYRRKIFNEIDYYDESVGTVGDWDFGLRFLQHHEIAYLRTSSALAFYSMRQDIKGELANTVFSDEHQYYENLMINKYLRNDLLTGKLGLGYIINSLQYEKDFVNSMNQNTKIIEDQNTQIADHLVKLDETIVQRTSVANFVKRSSTLVKNFRKAKRRT